MILPIITSLSIEAFRTEIRAEAGGGGVFGRVVDILSYLEE